MVLAYATLPHCEARSAPYVDSIPRKADPTIGIPGVDWGHLRKQSSKDREYPS